MDAIHLAERQSKTEVVGNVALGGAALFALMSASCCILPIGLTIVGLGGAWLSFLGPFVAYREVILVLVSIVVAYLWLRILMRKVVAPRPRLNITMVAIASMVTVLAWTAPLWEWEVSNTLLDAWANQR